MVDTVLNPTTPVTNGGIVTSTNPLPVSVTGAVTATAITVGTTTVGSGTNGRVLYDNAGVLGEMTNTGSGTVNVLQTAPAFLTSVGFPSVAWASKPAAGTAGTIVRMSDIGPKGSLWMDDGTRWKPVNNMCVLASLDVTSGTVSNAAEVIKLQTAALPLNFWQIGDIMRIVVAMTKSGTTDTGICNIRVGTAGTIGDAQINQSENTIMAAGNVTSQVIHDFRLESATTTQHIGNSNGSLSSGYSSAANGVASTARTISSTVANSLFFDIGILSGGGTNTVILQAARIEYWAAAN